MYVCTVLYTLSTTVTAVSLLVSLMHYAVSSIIEGAGKIEWAYVKKYNMENVFQNIFLLPIPASDLNLDLN